MTKAQQNTIDRLRARIIYSKSCGKPELYEFKKFQIKEYDHFLSVIIEHGRIGDEGTMAEVMARDYRHFFIGEKGGVRLVSLISNLQSSTPPKACRGVFKCVNYWHPAKKSS